ncbi:LpxL/LpxP family acyltransferase [Streptomyces sp. NPDC054887]
MWARATEFFRPSSSESLIGASRIAIAHPERLTSTQGAVVVTAHMACPILAAYWIAENYGPVSLISSTNLRHPKMRFYYSRRARQVQFSDGSDLSQIAVLRERLARNEYVLAMPDTQTPSYGGIEVQFFGHRTRMLAGPALLALRASVPLIPMTLWYDNSPVMKGELHSQVHAYGPGSIRERATQAIQEAATVFEKAITQHPESWALFKPLWPEAESVSE